MSEDQKHLLGSGGHVVTSDAQTTHTSSQPKKVGFGGSGDPVDAPYEAPAPTCDRAIFGLPQFTATAAGFVTSVLVSKYYSDTYLVSLDFIAALSFLAGLAGLYFQVFVGYLSDHTQSRYGRRKPFVGALGPPKEVLFVLLMFPLATSPTGASVWFAVVYFAFNVLAEGLDISLNAWAAEMTSDNTERARVFTWFNGMGFVGLIVAAMADAGLSSALGERTAYAVMSITLAVVGLVGYVLVLSRLRENPENVRTPIPLVPSLRRCARNACWVTYIRSQAVFSAINEITGLFTYLFQYVYDLDADKYVGLLVVAYAIACVASMPVTTYLTKRWGKVRVMRVYMWGVALYGGLAFVATYTSWLLLALAAIILGLVIGGVNVLSDVMLSDTIDYDELLCGKRREGAFMSVSRIPNQFFSVGGKALPLLVMAALGYKPNETQNVEVKFALRFFVSLFPAALALISYFLFLPYPIDESMHNRIRAAVSEMHAKSREQYAQLNGQPTPRGSVTVSVHSESQSQPVMATGVVAPNREVVPLTVEDPITHLLMPVPKPEFVAELGVAEADAAVAAAAIGTAAPDSLSASLLASDASVPVPSAAVARRPSVMSNTPQLSAADAAAAAAAALPRSELDEWLMDFFSTRELHVAAHFGAARVRVEIVVSCAVWLTGLVLLGAEGTVMFLRSSHYVSLIWVLGAATCSVLLVLDGMRLRAARRLEQLPSKLLHAMVNGHCESLARVPPSASAQTQSAQQRVSADIADLKAHAWRYPQWAAWRLLPLLMSVAGYFLFRASFVSDT